MIRTIFHKTGWIEKEPVERIAEKYDVTLGNMYGFHTFAIPDIAVFPEGEDLLTVEQLIKEYVHTLHKAANELRDILSMDKPS